ncbi:MAG TPA: hypothetical protein VFE65_20300, partial [Pseudonocardia sp.]|nr:hypothetical protein [Pseudonocardia sp.]
IVLASAICLFMMTFLCLLIYVRLSSMETNVMRRFRELEDRLGATQPTHATHAEPAARSSAAVSDETEVPDDWSSLVPLTRCPVEVTRSPVEVRGR